MAFGLVFDREDHVWRAVLLITNREALDRLNRTAKLQGHSQEVWTTMVFLEGVVLGRTLDKTMQKAMYCDSSDTLYLGASTTFKQPGFEALIVVAGVALPAPVISSQPELLGNTVKVAAHLAHVAKNQSEFRAYLMNDL